jgi:hydroxyacylglutathione hydrolase
MSIVASFVMNPFQENTYIIYDETKACVIIDPGCLMSGERRTITDFIKKQGLTPVRLLNTHCHLDHVFSNAYFANFYELGLECHELELPILEAFTDVSDRYGIPNTTPSPLPKRYIKADEKIEFGNTVLDVIFTPGHSPGSVTFYDAASNYVIAGDVLFHRSIGRTDLPGGDHKTLLRSIAEKLMPLPDDTIVYSGHGQATTIGYERVYNPFLS